jgi:HSP20 family protein
MTARPKVGIGTPILTVPNHPKSITARGERNFPDTTGHRNYRSRTHEKRGDVFLPNADIYETNDALNVVLEMPAVEKNSVEIRVEDGVLKVDGRLDFSKYQGLQPLYTEYNVGHYSRSFRLSSKIEQNKIGAELKDGVLSLVLNATLLARMRGRSPSMSKRVANRFSGCVRAADELAR